MKRIMIIAIVFVMIMSINYNAFGLQDYTNYAESLAKLDIFVGTNNGYELDRAPTRVEGVVMLIRLLGVEDKALEIKENNTPFTDVPKWACGYVSYAYNNNLTKGISDTQFGTSLNMNAKMYTTFILRSLGYDDKSGDFTYNDCLIYAKDIGLYNDNMFAEIQNSTFLRGHIAKISYDALYFLYKNTEITLLEKLVADGLIDTETANYFTSHPVYDYDNAIIKSDDNENKEENELTVEEVSSQAESVVFIYCQMADKTEAQGSGVILKPDGTILTNYHVIDDALNISVYFNDGTNYQKDVYVQDYNEELDLAIIKIDKTGLKSCKIGNSDDINIGQKVVAIGSPIGLFNTVSEGIISSIRDSLIQISAPISHGSSGGGLFNMKGELIGITSSGFEEGENLGFAIPINLANSLIEQKELTLNEFYYECNELDNYNDTPQPPTNIRIVAEGNDRVYINWDPVPEADYYYFYFQEDGEETYWYSEENNEKKKYNYGVDFSVEYYGLEPGKLYNIIVTSVDNGIESLESYFSFYKQGLDTDIYYNRHNGVPDFGAIFNVPVYRYNDDYDGAVFTYRVIDFDIDYMYEYFNILNDAGFVYSSSFDDDYGVVLIYDNYYTNQLVMIGSIEFDGVYCAAIYIIEN